jgi:hypothetical protein
MVILHNVYQHILSEKVRFFRTGIDGWPRLTRSLEPLEKEKKEGGKAFDHDFSMA